MPLPRPTHAIRTEDNLAERIAYERRKRGWSLDKLAKAMTEAGYPIHASAINKVETVSGKAENGTKRRRITVDELTAYAEVFGVATDDLLVSVDMIRTTETLAHIEALTAATRDLYEAAVRYWAEWRWILDFQPHMADAAGQLHIHTADGFVPISDVPDEDDHAPVLRALGRMLNDLRAPTTIDASEVTE